MKVNTNNKKKYHLKASSLTNAIFLCVIISVFCGCLVLISHYQNILNKTLLNQENLISRNVSSFNYFFANSSTLTYNKAKDIDLFDDGIISSLEKKNWGFYDILICKTFFKKDTVYKTVLVGNRKNTLNDLALYVTDYDKPLKLSGNTKIIGNIAVPNAKTDESYINGKKGNTITLKGKKTKSQDKLPKIHKDVFMALSNLPHISLNKLLKNDLLFNGFNRETKVIDLKGITTIKDINCKGNFVLLSKNNIHIDASSKLNDVVVIAPKITIDSGFKGNLQIIAKEKVVIEENVSLLYPSCIYIKEAIDSITVQVKKNSKVIGGIVIDGNTYNASLKNQIIIEEDATIVGNVYCYGKTQLKGQVIGSVYTDRLFLKTDASSYENVILNATIDKEALPDNFIELSLFNNSTNEKKYAVIKEF